MKVEPTTYRIVDADPEYGEYRDLTENKHQPLPDGVLRWYSNQHHVYASPDGYLVPINRVSDTRLQAIADASLCDHGKIDEHEYLTESTIPTADIWIRCQGAPELRVLLNALRAKKTGQ